MPKNKKEKGRAKDASYNAPSGNASSSAPEGVASGLGQKASFEGLPPNEQQLTEKTRRLADLCQYFTEHQIDIPADMVERITALSKLTIPDRVRALVAVNHDLMEYLNAVARVDGKPQ
jgi:hypothetical protein